MENRILTSGKVGPVYYQEGYSEVYVGSEGFWDVNEIEADKALAARRSTPPREIEIVEVDGTWKSRVVRIVPVTVVKVRGVVRALRDTPAGQVTLAGHPGVWSVSNASELRLRQQIEIVTTDGGPDTARVVQ